MQAMSMIDTSGNTLETVAPAKQAPAQGKQFGKVLNEQRQPEPERTAEAKPQAAEKPQAKPVQKQDTQQQAEQPAVEQQTAEQQVVEQAPVAKAEVIAEAKPKLQQTVVDLMKAIAGKETPVMQDDTVVVEEGASIEELLTQLVEQLDGSELTDSGLEGEQVLAGIDLTSLVEQLQTLKTEGGEEQLEQLVEQLAIQLEEQLVGEEALLENAELAAAAMPMTDPQAVAPKLVENLAQARQILQQAIDHVAAQKTPQVASENVVATETGKAGQELLFAEEAAEEIDPRFASLLKPRSENRGQQQQSLRQQVQGNKAQLNPEQVKVEAQATAEVKPEQTEVADFVQQLGKTAKPGLENLAQQAQASAQPTAAQQPQPLTGKLMPESPMVQLPSGQQVAESQIFDQVVARFSSSVSGGAKRMVLRMHPAELGSLKVELMVEGDRVRANLHAQSLQVQEVLERNLPQLRNALAEQGLKIDQFQVDVNRDQSQQQQFEQLAQQQQQRQGAKSRQPWQQSWESEEQIVPLAHLMQNGGGGISLHV